MSLNVALPVALEPTGDYQKYYLQSGTPIFQIGYVFNDDRFPGLHLLARANVPSFLEPSLFDLVAICDGFLSCHGDKLILRLPLLLNGRRVAQYNSAKQYMGLKPTGPQLRSITFLFKDELSNSSSIRESLRVLIKQEEHPSRFVQYVKEGTQSIGSYLGDDDSKVDNFLDDFLSGGTELMVRAGDTIANLLEHEEVTIIFRDSCGNKKLEIGVSEDSFGFPIKGNILNPSYFLFLLLKNPSTTNLLTKIESSPSAIDEIHPLVFLLQKENLPSNGEHMTLDLSSSFPPPPLLISDIVYHPILTDFSFKGIEMGALGEWHESRNSPNPVETKAPVQWRNYGKFDGETNFSEIGRFLVKLKPDKLDLIPGLKKEGDTYEGFDTSFTPQSSDIRKVKLFWERYSSQINVAAEVFEVPCELILAIACKESAAPGFFWFDNDDFEKSNEMSVIAMEPLRNRQGPSFFKEENPDHEVLARKYENLAGRTGATETNVRNVIIPTPWNDNEKVHPEYPLKWGELKTLVHNYKNIVRVSPGIIQTLIFRAKEMIDWTAAMYGPDFISSLSININNVKLTAINPPTERKDIFQYWFGISVDNKGQPTDDREKIDPILTRHQRAFHSIITGTAYLKKRYNNMENISGKTTNLITDFDVPTLGSGYNDNASPVSPAKADSDINEKWKDLFALLFFDFRYPKEYPRLFNAAIDEFNQDIKPVPKVRLWSF